MALKKSKPARKKPAASASVTPLLSHLKSTQPYPPGKPIEEVQREYGLDEVIKLASNENPIGPSSKAIRAMQAAAAEMNLYPDGGGHYLREAIARSIDVDPNEIVLGNGSDEITTLLATCYLGPGRSMVTSDYAFVRYRMAAQLVRAKVNTVAMKRYEHDTIRLAKAAGRDTALLFVDNPCNPTGTMIQKRAFERMLAAVPEKTIVVADEAYYEFARADPKYPDTLKLRAKHPNLMVTRTFSKAYGLAGLRIGYGVARREIVDDLNRVRAPFNANRMAQAAALAALDDRTHLRRVVQTNERGKTFLAKTFKRLGIGYTPTWANFFLVDFAPVGRTGKEAYDRLLPRGVIVRPMNGYGLASSVRISIGTPEQNQKLAMLLSEWLRP